MPIPFYVLQNNKPTPSYSLQAYSTYKKHVYLCGGSVNNLVIDYNSESENCYCSILPKYNIKAASSLLKISLDPINKNAFDEVLNQKAKTQIKSLDEKIIKKLPNLHSVGNETEFDIVSHYKRRTVARPDTYEDFLAEFKELNFIEPVYEIEELEQAFLSIKKKKYNKYISNTQKIIDDINDYLGD